MTASTPCSTRVCVDTGSPHVASASYAWDCRSGVNPRRLPRPWQIRCSGRVAVTRGSFWRRLPAAEFRGFANGCLPAATRPGVELLEVGQPEEDLAAHLDQLGHGELVGAGQLGGHVGQGAHVQRDVLAGAPVAPGERAGEVAVLVEQVHRQPVDLQLAEVLQLLGGVGELALHPQHPLAQLLGLERVVQREHPLEVVDRDEVGGEAAADPLRRARRRDQRRVLAPPGACSSPNSSSNSPSVTIGASST